MSRNKSLEPKNNNFYIDHVDTELLGKIQVAFSDRGLYMIRFGASEEDFLVQLCQKEGAFVQVDPTKTRVIKKQLVEYTEGKRKRFIIEIDWSGFTEFQKSVLKATLNIPYGRTSTYGEIGAKIGRPGSARAVGQAEASNRIPIVIPCHRVIGSDGSMTGYGGRSGIGLKKKILDFEQAN